LCILLVYIRVVPVSVWNKSTDFSLTSLTTCTCQELINFAEGNCVLILILPGRVTAAYQPVDRGLCGPFRTVSHQDANCRVSANQNIKQNWPRYNLKCFVCATRSWATFVANVMRASRTTWTFPNVISDYFY
jgi:hypothetical protein